MPQYIANAVSSPQIFSSWGEKLVKRIQNVYLMPLWLSLLPIVSGPLEDPGRNGEISYWAHAGKKSSYRNFNFHVGLGPEFVATERINIATKREEQRWSYSSMWRLYVHGGCNCHQYYPWKHHHHHLQLKTCPGCSSSCCTRLGHKYKTDSIMFVSEEIDKSFSPCADCQCAGVYPT